MSEQLRSEREWVVNILRIGNRAVRAAQARSRRQGVPNWYSLNGRLVSDQGEVIHDTKRINGK
jgi:hypothetical protein